MSQAITTAELADWEADLHALPNPVVRAAQRIEAAASEHYPLDSRVIAEAIERETGHRAKTRRLLAEVRRLRNLVGHLEPYLSGRCPDDLKAAALEAAEG